MTKDITRTAIVGVLSLIFTASFLGVIYYVETTPQKIIKARKEGFDLGKKVGKQELINDFGDNVKIKTDSLAPVRKTYEEALRELVTKHQIPYNPHHKPYNSKFK